MDEFEKYDRMGAYHWRQADPAWDNRDFNPPLLARYQRLAAVVQAGEGPVLDVGCGDGFLSHLVLEAERGPVVGMDLSFTGLRLAGRELAVHHPDGGWALAAGSCLELPFAPGRFRGALLADVIEHLAEPEAALEEIRRVLQPGGWLALTTPLARPDRRWDRHHVTEYTPASLKELLAAHFGRVELLYFWPLMAFDPWRRAKHTYLVITTLARLGINLFNGRARFWPARFGQLLALCR